MITFYQTILGYFLPFLKGGCGPKLLGSTQRKGPGYGPGRKLLHSGYVMDFALRAGLKEKRGIL